MNSVVWCPKDGVVEVSLCNLFSVSTREGGKIEFLFECPVCGSQVTQSVKSGDFFW